MADETSKPRLSRATAQPSRSGGDPLAELARLIGRDEVYQQMRSEVGRPKAAAERAPWMARRDAREDLRGPQPEFDEPPVEQPRRLATHQAPTASAGWRGPTRTAPEVLPRDERDYAQPAAATGAYEEPVPTRAYDTFDDQRAAEAAPAYDSYETPDYYDDQEQYADEQPLAPRRRKGVWAAAAMLGVAVVGGAGALGYKSVTGGSDTKVPVIKADTAPAKLVPAAPSRDPQTRTASLDGARGVGERLVSNEEQPVDLDAKIAAARANAAAATTGAISPTGSSPSMMSLASAPPTAAPAGDPGGPKKVRTISIRPDGSPVAPAAPNSAPRMTNSTDPGARLPGDMAGRPAPSRAAAPQQIAPTADPARPTRSASLGPTPSQQTAPAAPTSGPMVQLASQKSEADAHSAYRALQAKYPNILSGRQATIKRVEIADKGTFYRAQVGPFGSSDQASEFCNSLKAVGGQCIVQRN